MNIMFKYYCFWFDRPQAFLG